jgi:putative hydrolase of the HAD superfamily
LGQIDKSAIKEAYYWADRQAENDPAMRVAPFRRMMDLHFGWQFQKLNIHNVSKQAEAAEQFTRAAERHLRRNRDVLHTLSLKGYRLGVVSNAYGNVEILCREFGYDDFMTVFIDSIIEKISKPDPKIYQLALERLQTAPESTWMVGDNFERDILPAKSIGMKTAWLTADAKRTPPDPSQVDIVLTSLEQLPHKLARFESAAA